MKPSNDTNSSLLLLELNEANRNLLQAASATGTCPNIAKILHFEETHTLTDDTDESGFLEPWAQWVSIHTGVSSQIHGIKHLGCVPNLRQRQIWEILGEHGITSGIWGVMNGSRRNEENCLFFLADPWTTNEMAYPETADQFALLARYISRNYLNLSIRPFISASWTYAWGLLRILSLSELIEAWGNFGEGLLKFGPSKMVLGAFFEFTSTCAFLKFKARYKPRFSILFLNLIAHAQHHYWINENKLSRELLYVFKVIDLILEKVLRDKDDNEVLLITNGLSQVNTNSEDPWILYRQIDHAQFIKHIGIKALRVEPLMTHDALLYFASQKDCQNAFALLSTATINSEHLLYVERDPVDVSKLFYRLAFTKPVNSDALFTVGDRDYKFFDCFQKVVKRTGKHSQNGFVMQTKPLSPPMIPNHELAHYILRFFGISEPLNVGKG